ncbi:unnamed protein product, partial [Staurois parvus]
MRFSLVAVVPSCFHFVITVDCGIFSGKEISRMDLLHRWQPIMVTKLEFTELLRATH